MVRFLQHDTYGIDAKSFKDKAIDQGWLPDIVYNVICRLIQYHCPFVSDHSGKVYVSSHYRFDLLDLKELDESFFDWYRIDDEEIIN